MASDLPALNELETLCFPPHRRDGPASLRRSLASPRQSVWVVPGPTAERLAAAAVYFYYPKSLRVYSVSVHPESRRGGLGDLLLAKAFALARRRGVTRLRLEADRNNAALVSWYERRGFSIVATLADYYGPGEDAVRMEWRRHETERA